MARLFVVIATVGRAALTARTVDLLADQRRPADGVVVVGAAEADVAGVAAARGRPDVLIAAKGSCSQRNAGLDRLEGRADIVCFFDDDFIPAPDYLAEIEALFDGDPGIAGANGHMIADGINHGGYTIEQAHAMIAADTARPATTPAHSRALYGCNMAIRMVASAGVRFDEALPLYGWQEDIDYSRRVAARGRLVETGRARGVHLGVTGGRTSGRRLGYSQVVNPVYLRAKGTMPAGMAWRLIARNVAANLARAWRPEPHIDRRGRLHGNLTAAADLLRGRADPRRILDF